MRDITSNISSYADVIDVRDIIERFEELREDRTDDDADEFVALADLLNELRDNGGDHQWEGAWYPVTMIRDSYFKEYAQELAEEIGAIPSHTSWPAYCIDWDWAARDLKMDYTAVEYDGITYWYR